MSSRSAPLWLKVVFTIATLGIGLLIWRLWEHFKIGVKDSQIEIEYTSASPHQLDDALFDGERQPQFMHEGVGPLFHRRYYVDIENETHTNSALMTIIQENLNKFAPSDVAIFERIMDEDTPGLMQKGDDYFIHILGPWNGPVRVIEVTETSFSFITLDHHLEAGEIQFRVIDHPTQDGITRFEIRSWSRSRDSLVSFFYHILPFAKFAQTRMWVYFCQRVVEISDGQAVDEVHVVTHVVPFKRDKGLGGQNLERWQQYHPQLEHIRRTDLNFDLDRREEFIEHADWNFDQYQVDLPSEEAGPPEAEGVWATAKDILLNYEFPDPDLISGIFVPDEPLAERVLVLEATFLIFTFQFGVKVHDVIDEQRQDDEQGTAQVWGYSYTTTQQHFEMGEITFTIWKFVETGQVQFRIESYSRTGVIDNLIYRLGFALFGRRLQQHFAHTSLNRMQELVINRLADSENDIEMETPNRDERSVEQSDQS